MKAVFLDQQTFIETIDFNPIRAHVKRLNLYALTSPQQVIERCQGADIIITNKVLITKEIINALPRLKLICVAATGTNNIDIPAATERGVEVMNASGYSTDSVSQYVFGQLLEYFNQTHINNQKVAAGHWPRSLTFCMHSPSFDQLSGKTIGIIGYGNIGKAVAKIASAFGMKVLISERVNQPAIRHGRVAFEEVIAQADIISLHCPQTSETEQLFSVDMFKKMRSHALLINTARGAIIYNKALLSALHNNEIGAAILDVLDQEPPPADHILLANQPANLFITAHIAWASAQAQQQLIHLITENIKKFKEGSD